MRSSGNNHAASRSAAAPLRWWNTLFFRLALVVNLAVISILGGAALVDHRRQRTVHIDNEVARLREEAKVLQVARTQLRDMAGFQRFVDEFCRQMGSVASPGHHIAVFDGAGTIVLRAHERANPELEAKMAATKQGRVARFTHGGDTYVAVGLDSGDSETVVVAQTLAPIEQVIQAQRTSTLASTAILVTLVFGITTTGFLVWVRDPLRELVHGVTAVGNGNFAIRVRPSGSAELRYLAEQVNEMVQSLESVDRAHRAEMKRAREIQRGLLPDNQHGTEHFDIAALFLPTDSVGGDLYDVVELEDGSMLLAVLDVLGHGVPAALYTALLRTVLRHHAATTVDITGIVEVMNDDLGRVVKSSEFATCFLARLGGAAGDVSFVRAGHEPPVVVRANGDSEFLDGGDLPLGVERGVSYKLRRSTLRPGDRLFLFTDGLHEVFNPGGRPFGRQRLASLLAETSGLPLEQQLDVVVHQVLSYQDSADFADDVTLLAARRR